MLNDQICLPYRRMNSTEQPKTPMFGFIWVRSCSKSSKRSSLLPITNFLHPELSLGSYRCLVQRRLGRHSYFSALSYLLRTDLASLGLQRCTEPLPPQKHPFLPLETSRGPPGSANKVHQPNSNATTDDEANGKIK